MKTFLVKLKNLHIRAYLNLNDGSVKQKPKICRVQIWSDLSKHAIDTLKSLRENWGKNRFWKNAAWGKFLLLERWWWKPCGEFCLGAWVKNNRFSFLTPNVFFCNSKSINFFFLTHGGIYMFEKTFNKYCGERQTTIDSIVKWVRVSLRMILKYQGGNRQYARLPFCWSWTESWDNFRKRGDSRKWRRWFWNGGIGTSAH